MDNLSQAKADQRHLIRQRLRSLPVTVRAQYSKKIARNVLSLPELQESQTICCYASLADEVDTRYILETLLTTHQVVLPKIESRHLRLYRINSLEMLQPGTYGILEPEQTNPVQACEVDCFIVPGLAFDLSGTRLGRGKGYYDGLLQQTQAITIGLSYSVQIFPLLPKASYDIVMNIIVTEQQSIRITNSQL